MHKQYLKFISMKKTIQLNILLYLAFISFNIIPCYGQKATEFRLHGTIENNYNGKIIFSYNLVNDTSTVNNGHFSFRGDLQEPQLSHLTYANRKIFFYVEPGDMKLTISSSLPSGYHLSGSRTNEEGNELKIIKQPLYDKRDQIYKMIQSTSDSHGKQSFKQTIDSINDNLQSVSIAFIKTHPHSYVSLDELRCLDMDNNPIKMIRELFEGLGNNLKNSFQGKQINKFIKGYENTDIGFPAPDFTTIGYNEEKINLSSFKGKTVILEFWASWCVPCMQSIPHLKALYHKYQEEGLIVIGVSKDSNKSSWINAIKKYQLDIWPQALAIVDIENARKGYISESEIISIYPTNPIPKVFVIDKEGKIIKKWTSYSSEQEKEQDKFFEEYFIKSI